MFLEGVFTDAEGLGDLVVVAGGGFQVAEGVLKAVGLRLLVCAG